MKKVIGFLLVCFYVNAFGQCVSPTLPVINSSTNTICSGQSVTLTVASGSLNSATNWQWYSGGCGNTSVGSGTQIVLNPLSSTSYFARGEGSCVIPASCANVSITVLQSPSVTATSTNVLCFGQSNGQISLSASGPGPFTYNWSNSSTGPMLFGLSQAFYTATITASNGCKTSTTINVTEPNPLLTNVSPVQTVCLGQQSTVFVNSSGGTSPYSFTITNLSSNVSTSSITSSGMNVSEMLTYTTQYIASVKDLHGCASSPQLILVNVTQSLSVSGYSLQVCDGDAVTFTTNATGGLGLYSYNWSNSTNNSSLTVIANAVNSPATYTLSIGDGCTIPNTSATFTVYAAICTGIKEQNTDHEFLFYPNPVKNYLMIEQDNSITQIKLFSIDGKEILDKEISNLKTEINLSDLSNGMYYLRFYDKTNVARTEKIIVQH